MGNTMQLRQPAALTIAGSDSGGGAGIQADLHVFAALAVHGTSAITCLTAQNLRGVRAIQAAQPAMVRQQIEAVFDELPPQAVKTGMLFSRAIIREVAAFFAAKDRPPLVVDPVMVATNGTRLLQTGALRALCDELLPRATLVTPNLPEAEQLLGHPITTLEAMRQAAREIHDRFGCATLVKGGHLRGGREAADLFYDGRHSWLLTAPRIRRVSIHGTGCAYSAAITGYLALGRPLPQAVARAKEFITQAIARSRPLGKHTVLNWFWARAKN